MHLVDASIWIHVFRRQPKGRTRIQELLKPLVISGTTAITEWTILELMVGIRATEKIESVLTQFERPPRLDFPAEKWPQSWALASELRKRGFTPSAADCFISTIAISHNVPLLHCDRDFEQIAAHTDLKTIDWTEYLET